MESPKVPSFYPPVQFGARVGTELVHAATGTFTNPPAADSTDGLLDYLAILIKNKGKLFVASLFGMVLAIIFTLPQAPVYRARTTLEIQGVNNEFLNSKQVSPVSDDGSNSNVIADIQTQIKILDSEFLVDRVVDRLEADGKLSFTIPKRFPLLGGFLHANSSASNFKAQFRRDALKNLSVSQISQTRVIEVYFKASNPQLAADFVNLLDAEYIESNMEARWRMSEQTSKWLGHQIDDIREKLERSELKLQTYARQSGLLFTSGQFGSPDRTNVSDEKLRQMQEELSRAQDVRALAQSRYEMAKVAPADTLSDVLNDQSLRDLQKQLTDLRRQEAELNSVYTPKSEKLQRVDVQIAPLEAAFAKERDAILQRIQNDYNTALRHERLLKADYAMQVNTILDQADKSIQYNILKRDVDTNRQLYDSMLQQVKASTVASAIRSSNIRIVDPGKVPSAPYTPNIKINAALGWIAGLVFGIAFVLVRKSTNSTFQQPGELQMWTNLSELGVIPSEEIEEIEDILALGRRGSAGSRFAAAIFPWIKRTPSRPAAAASSVEVAVWRKRPTMLAEAFRTVLTSVLFSGENGTLPKVLVLTSANAEEGKTSVTANLALALTEIRRKVLIIDADLRRPRMHQIFQLDNERGLSTLLNQETLPEETLQGSIQLTHIPGVNVLTSGPPTSSAANLLHSPNLPVILHRFKNEFDMILIDTPPAIHLTDSRIVGRLADAVILVARAGQTTRESFLAVASRFREDRTILLGSILNDWTPANRQQARHVYYGYGHGDERAESSDLTHLNY